MANNLNPMMVMAMLRQSNPRDVVLQIANQQYQNDPFVQNLVQMAEKGDTQVFKELSVECLARKVKISRPRCRIC